MPIVARTISPENTNGTLNCDDAISIMLPTPLFDATVSAMTERAPHKISQWVRELASAFQGFYHDCPVLRDDVDPALRQARLWLVEASRIGLSIGLDLLGVDAPEQI